MSASPRLKNLLSLAFIIFIDNLSYYIVIPVLLRIIVHGEHHILGVGWDLSHRNILFGFAVAVSPILGLIAAPFIGSLSDRIGRKKTLFMCLCGSCLAFLLPIIGVTSGSIILIILGRAIAGVSDCSQAIAQAAIADATTGKLKAQYMGIVLLAVMLALVLGPFLGSFLSDKHVVSWFDIATPYWFGFALALFNLVLILEFFKEIPFTRIKRFALSDIAKTTKKVFTHRSLAFLLLVFFLEQFSWAQYYQNSYLYLTEALHFNTKELGIFASFLGIWGAAGLAFLYPLLLRKFSLQKLFIHTLWMMTLMLALVMLPITWMQWAMAVPLGLLGSISYAAGVTLLSDCFPEHRQGWIMGTISLLISLAWLLGGFLPGFLMNASNWAAILLATVLMLLASYFCFYHIKFNKTTINSV